MPSLRHLKRQVLIMGRMSSKISPLYTTIGSSVWGCLWSLYMNFVLLLYDVHLVDEAFATTELVDNEEYVADVDVDTTLQVVVEVDVTAE